MGSSRFPGKVLKNIEEDKTVLDLVFERISLTKGEPFLLTSIDKKDDILEHWAKEKDIKFFRGSETNVLKRYIEAGKLFNSQNICRITADCPLIDPVLIDNIFSDFLQNNLDYASNTITQKFPDGLDVEIFKYEKLAKIYNEEKLESRHLEHVTPFFYENKFKYNIKSFSPEVDYKDISLTVDYEEDLERISKLIKINNGSKNLNFEKIKEIFTKENIMDIKNLMFRNKRRNESYIKQLKGVKKDFSKSLLHLNQAKSYTPLGSQTFSKSYTHLPIESAPLFCSEGKNCYLKDLDGNSFIDLVSGLGAVTLGYGLEEINEIITHHVSKGITFSLPHKIELDFAKEFFESINFDGMVKYSKNGTDVTSAAIRLARYVTNKDQVLLTGYHGWADWSISVTSKNGGIPTNIKDLSKSLKLSSVKNYIKENAKNIACLIIETTLLTKKEVKLISEITSLCKENNIIIIADEIISCYRDNLAGYMFDNKIEADLYCLGKGMANGLPIGLLMGKASLMNCFEDIFFSGTFQGETLTLVVAKKVLEIYKRDSVCEKLISRGKYLDDKLNQLIRENQLSSLLSFKGRNTWKIWDINLKDEKIFYELKSLMIQTLARHGILSIGSNNINYSHNDNEIESIISGYDKLFKLINYIQNTETSYAEYLDCKPIKALFTVR